MTLEEFRKVFTDAVRDGEIFTPSCYIVDLRDRTVYWGDTSTLADERWTSDDPAYPGQRRAALTETEIYSTRFFGP